MDTENVKILLVSAYEMGRQPFGLASPAAWLIRDGHQVTCADLAIQSLPEAQVGEADLIAFHLPMHTATRLIPPVIEHVRRTNPRARLACYGLYAAINEELLRNLGVAAIIGGEFEAGLVEFARGGVPPKVSYERLKFLAPNRTGLPDLARYAKLAIGSEKRKVAYTESSRGCKHLCRHCPVVPIYHGKFRIVGRAVVLEDIRQQVAAGAVHVTFGDPDFFNGPRHAMEIVTALHAEFPDVTYDTTIKIEHLCKHRDLMRPLKETGCLFVTSAVESVDDAVLVKLEKHHTCRDFFEVAARMCKIGLILSPTFIPFTPWTTLEGYRALLKAIADLGLVDHVSSVQLALRLLVTSGSRLLELEDLNRLLGPFDFQALVYPWRHPQPEIDRLADHIFQLVHVRQKQGDSRAEIFARVWQAVYDAPLPDNYRLLPRTAVPYLDEPWYC
jgi:radical SAM superfamily enzyme YgiQ (UPF0313 family)